MPAVIYPYAVYPFIRNDAFREMACILEGARGRLEIIGETELFQNRG